jgi:enoyl-CoA hydratase
MAHMSGTEKRSAEQMMVYTKDTDNKIAYLTIRRPEKLNAPDVDMKIRFADLVKRAGVDDEVKVLIIRSEGDHFGTGADLEDHLTRRKTDPLREFRFEDEGDIKYPPEDTFRYSFNATNLYANESGGCRSLQEFKKISIVEVKGYCYGWHFYLAADADIVISSDDALFGHSAFRYMGWGPRMWTWIETMGLRKFQDMLFTGRPFTAAEMDACNFLTRVVPRDQLEQEVEKYALACAHNGPTDRIVMQKTFLELYKQQRGEYQGSLLTSVFEAIAVSGVVKAQEGEFELSSEVMGKGLGKAVKEFEARFPEEWHLGQWGKKKS